MKATFSLASIAFAGAAMGAICNNNCGRAVAGNAKKSPSFADRSASCVAFLATTTIVTPGTATVTSAPEGVFARNVHGPRADAAPVVTGEKPAYATECADATAYWSACQCIPGVTPTVVSVTAATPTVTVVPEPYTCHQGLEWAMYHYDSPSDERNNLLSAGAYGIDFLDTQKLLVSKTPLAEGASEKLFVPWANAGSSFSAYGKEFPYDSAGSLIDHRGYFVPAKSGFFKISAGRVDDAMAFWVGDKALNIHGVQDAALKSNYEQGPMSSEATFAVTAGVPVPFRLFWSNCGGPGSLDNVKVTDVDGVEILGPNSAKNKQVLSKCEGANVPAALAPLVNRPAWKDETYAGDA